MNREAEADNQIQTADSITPQLTTGETLTEGEAKAQVVNAHEEVEENKEKEVI